MCVINYIVNLARTLLLHSNPLREVVRSPCAWTILKMTRQYVYGGGFALTVACEYTSDVYIDRFTANE